MLVVVLESTMGQRISYFKNNFGKTLKDLIFENFSSFRQWYLEMDKSSMADFKEPFGNEKVKNYFNLNPNFETDFEKLDKKLVDELTSEFIGSYCDLTDRDSKLLELFGPTMNKWRYVKSGEIILLTKDEDFIRLWNYVIKGRSLKDNAQFDSYTNDYKIGFLTFGEHRLLKEKIESYFGTIEIIKEKYWTDNEKKEFDRAISNLINGAFSLSGHNPKSAGLEYILQVLEEIRDDRNELIIGIESL